MKISLFYKQKKEKKNEKNEQLSNEEFTNNKFK